MSSFDQLGISAERVAMLSAQGIKNPTPVQEAAIPLVLKDKDVIGQAQTGTGKTLAFVLPMLEKMNVKSDKVQGLIVTPTRELALQITEEVKRFIGTDEGIRVLAVYGGQDVEAQLAKLKGNMHLIIATPGRLLDHLRRETIQLFSVRTLVLDEADQMLHMGFLGEVEEILRNTPSHRQTLLFSATMPGAIRDLASRILRKPEEVTVRGKQVTVKEIRQLVIETSDRNKQAALKEMIDETRPYLGMIFCRTKRRASTLNEALQEAGYASDELHGDLSQAKREQVMKKFREAKLQLLVATDIAARGLDVEGVTHVYNYDIPHDVESYIHRIGRTGRAGESGMAITFAAPKDRPELAKIESGIDMGIERRTIGSSALAGGEGPAARRAAGAGAGTRGAGGGRRDAGSAAGGRSAGAGRGAGGRSAGAGRGGSGRSAGTSRGAGGAFDAGAAAEGPAFGRAAGGGAAGKAGRTGGRAGEADFGRGGRSAGGAGADFGRGGRAARDAGAAAGRDGRSGARGASATPARGRSGTSAAGDAGDRRTAAAEWPGYEVRPREPGGRSGGGKPGSGGRREGAEGGGRRGNAASRPGAEGGGRSAGGRSAGGRSAGGRSAGGRSAGGRSGPGSARGGRSPQGGGAGRGAGSPGRGSRGPGGRGGRSR